MRPLAEARETRQQIVRESLTRMQAAFCTHVARWKRTVSACVRVCACACVCVCERESE
jgi:hypothetical protein